MEAVRPFGTKVRLNAPDRQIHLGQTPCGRVTLLSKNRNVVAPPVVRRDEALGLHEHPARAAAGIVDPSSKGLQHFNQQTNDWASCIELAGALPLSDGELSEKILVDAAEDVLSTMSILECQIREELDHLAEFVLI